MKIHFAKRVLCFDAGFDLAIPRLLLNGDSPKIGRDVLGNERIIQLARDLNSFGAAGWGIREASSEKQDGQMIISVVGRGIGNVGRKIG